MRTIVRVVKLMEWRLSGPYNIRRETSVRDNQANKGNQTKPDWSRRTPPAEEIFVHRNVQLRRISGLVQDQTCCRYSSTYTLLQTLSFIYIGKNTWVIIDYSGGRGNTSYTLDCVVWGPATFTSDILYVCSCYMYVVCLHTYHKAGFCYETLPIIFTMQRKTQEQVWRCNLTDERASPQKHSLHEKTAASVLLKPFISSNEWCHTTGAPKRICGTPFSNVNNIHVHPMIPEDHNNMTTQWCSTVKSVFPLCIAPLLPIAYEINVHTKVHQNVIELSAVHF